MENNNKINIKSVNTSILIQFVVYCNSNSICSLLKKLNSKGVNISASTISNSTSNKLQLKFVVGQNTSGSQDDANTTRTILDRMKLQFKESKVVKSSSQNTLNILSTQLDALLPSVDIYSFYYANNGDIIYEVCCPTKTIQILNSLY